MSEPTACRLTVEQVQSLARTIGRIESVYLRDFLQAMLIEDLCNDWLEMRAAQAEIPAKPDSRTLVLNEYQAVNLFHAFTAARGLFGTERNPLWVLDTGDWLGEIHNTLEDWNKAKPFTCPPNVPAGELARRAKDFK